MRLLLSIVLLCVLALAAAAAEPPRRVPGDCPCGPGCLCTPDRHCGCGGLHLVGAAACPDWDAKSAQALDANCHLVVCVGGAAAPAALPPGCLVCKEASFPEAFGPTVVVAYNRGDGSFCRRNLRPGCTRQQVEAALYRCGALGAAAGFDGEAVQAPACSAVAAGLGYCVPGFFAGGCGPGGCAGGCAGCR